MKTKLTGIERASRVFLAVLTGLLIWASAVNNEVFQVEAKFPLRLSTLHGHSVVSQSSDSVTVRYTGSGWNMLAFQLNGIPATAQATYRIEPGTIFPALLEIQMSPTVTDPDGPVAAERVTPSQITCTIDTIITREVPVSPVFADGIPGRFRFTTVEPASVTISGPASSVDRTDSVPTLPIQPGSFSGRSSLAPCANMVAYSVDSVRVLVFDPAVPSPNTAVRPDGLLTP